MAWLIRRLACSLAGRKLIHRSPRGSCPGGLMPCRLPPGRGLARMRPTRNGLYGCPTSAPKPAGRRSAAVKISQLNEALISRATRALRRSVVPQGLDVVSGHGSAPDVIGGYIGGAYEEPNPGLFSIQLPNPRRNVAPAPARGLPTTGFFVASRALRVADGVPGVPVLLGRRSGLCIRDVSQWRGIWPNPQ